MATESYDYGEVEKTMMYYSTPLVKESDLPLNFYLLDLPQNNSGSWAQQLVDLWMANMPRGQWANWGVSEVPRRPRSSSGLPVATEATFTEEPDDCIILGSPRILTEPSLCLQVGNHDQPRIASAAGQTYAALINMLLLTLPGTPSTYYGEELGMENINITGSQDPAGKHDRVKTSTLETAGA